MPDSVTTESVFTPVRLADRDGLWSIHVGDGRITQLEPAPVDCLIDDGVIDGQGLLVLPGLIEPHCHIDKTYSVAALPAGPASAQGALRDAIAAMSVHKANRTSDDVRHCAEVALLRAITQGVSCMNSHVDLGSVGDLDILQMLLDLRDAYSDRIDLTLTLLVDAGSPEGFDLARLGLALGAHAVGGAPALTENPAAGIAACFELATEFGCAIDLHIDETEDPSSPCLELLADCMLERGWTGRVVASHCCSLSQVEASQRAGVIAKVAQAGIHVVALPACNLFLMGRDLQPTPRAIAPVNDLQAAAVNVCVGSDNVQDPFHPLGDYDPLSHAALLMNVAHYGGGESLRALNSATHNAAVALGIDDHGVAVGAAANFSLYECETVLQSLTERPLRRRVVYKGRTVLQQSVRAQWTPAATESVR